MTVIYKRSVHYIVGLLFIFGFTLLGCSKDEKQFEDVLLAGTEYMEVSNKKAEYSFDLLSSVNYSLSADVDWIEFSQLQGDKGKKKISFTVTKNDLEERSGIIQVHFNDQLNREILVVQEAGTINVFYVSPDGQGDGRTWATASSFDMALSLATSGSEIHLTEGTYVPTKFITGGDAAEEGDRTFEINKNIKIVGG